MHFTFRALLGLAACSTGMPSGACLSPVAAAGLPPELLSLLPADVQQQVMQQGPGMMNNGVMMQMQQPGGPPPQQQQRSFGFSGYGSGPQQQPLQGHYGSPLPPGAAVMLGPSLQQQLQLHQQRSHLPPGLQSYAAGPSELPSNAMDSTSVFMHQLQQQQQQGHHSHHQQPAPQQQHHHMQQQHLQHQQYHPQQQQQQQQQQMPPPQYHQQQHQQQSGPMGGIPLLRSEPLGPLQPQQAQPPKSEALAALTTADAGEKAALLVALARSVGVSQHQLAQAMMESGTGAASGGADPGQAGSAEAAAPAAAAVAVAAPAAAAAAPAGAIPQPPAVVKLEAAPGGSPVAVAASLGQQQLSAEQVQQQQAAATASDSLGKGGTSGSVQPSAGATEPGTQSMRSLDSAALPGSSDALPSVSSPKQPQVEQQHPGAVPPPAAGSAAVPAGGLLPPAAAPGSAAEAPSRQPLDLEQLQSAVNGGGLSSGFSSDANLLLQLVAAVEAAQQQSGQSKERMRSLSLKLFNVSPCLAQQALGLPAADGTYAILLC